MYNYCKTCRHDDGDIGFCDKCYYSQSLEEKGIPPTEYEAKTKPITNADRIRAMSDEELAYEISEKIDCCVCKSMHNTEEAKCPCRPNQACVDFWLDWLRQEARDG